jgi:hypothetical protein
MNKKWYMSKTLWVNFIGFIAIGIQVVTGEQYFSPEYQAMALTVVNAILRMVTKEPLKIKK